MKLEKFKDLTTECIYNIIWYNPDNDPQMDPDDIDEEKRDIREELDDLFVEIPTTLNEFMETLQMCWDVSDLKEDIAKEFDEILAQVK